VALDATDTQASMRLGDLYDVQERFPDAVLAYTNAYRWWPDSALPLASLGRAYYRSGQCGEALPPLEQSLQIEPTGPLTYQALAACYLELGQVDQAITVIHDGLKNIHRTILCSECYHKQIAHISKRRAIVCHMLWD